MAKRIATDRLIIVCACLVVVVLIAAFTVLTLAGDSVDAFRGVSLVGTACIALITIFGLGSKTVKIQRGVDEVTNGLMTGKIDRAAKAAVSEHLDALPAPPSELVLPALPPAPAKPDSDNPWERAHGHLPYAIPPLSDQT